MPKSINNKFPKPDMSLLNEMSDGDHDFFMEIVNLFIDNAPSMLRSIVDSANNEDIPALRFATHKIMSDLFVVGLNDAAAVVGKIEISAANGIIEKELVIEADERITQGIKDLKMLQ